MFGFSTAQTEKNSQTKLGKQIGENMMNSSFSNLMAFFVVACQQLVNAGRLFCRFIENQCTSNRVWHFIFLLTILRIFFIKNITSTSQLPIGIHTLEFQIGNCSQYVTRLLWYVAYYQVHIHAISWSGFFFIIHTIY